MTQPVVAEVSPHGPERVDIYSSFADKDLVKAIPGARWDTEHKIWHTPLSWAACKQLRGLFGDRLQVGEYLAAWAWQEYTHRVQLVEQLKAMPDVQGDEDLWPAQRIGVEFFYIAGQALLGDEMGTGKTAQALRAIRRLKDKGSLPVLVVCPNSVKNTWREQAARWAPELDVRIVRNGAAKARKDIASFVEDEADVLVINWEAIRLYTRLAPYGSIKLKKCTECDRREGDPELKTSRCEVHPKELNEVDWGTVVADEAHHMKDARAKQSRAVWAVAHQQPCYRFAMTGTPIGNTPDDLWALLHFINPTEWPTKSRYVDRYCLSSWNPFGGLDIAGLKPETRDEFYAIFDSRFLRRPRSAVMRDVPVIHERRYATMSARQAKAYKQMVEHQIAILDESDDIVIATNPLALMTRLLQFAAAYAQLDENGKPRLSNPSCKLDELEQVIIDVAEPMVVFAESRQLIELAEQRFTKNGTTYVSIHGGVKEAERALNVQMFQRNEAQLCLVTLGAGGEGLDGLQHGARAECWLQRSTSMLKNKQGEGRINRGGQEAEQILRVEIVTEGTIEQTWLDNLLEGKEAHFEEIVRDKQKLMTLLKETL